MIPSVWVGVVLALGVFRLVRLVGWDDLPPIVQLRNRVTGARTTRQTATVNDALGVADDARVVWTFKRPLLYHFLGCAYCLGAWISLAAYLGWRFEPRWTLYVLAPFALSAAVGIIARRLDP